MARNIISTTNDVVVNNESSASVVDNDLIGSNEEEFGVNTDDLNNFDYDDMDTICESELGSFDSDDDDDQIVESVESEVIEAEVEPVAEEPVAASGNTGGGTDLATLIAALVAAKATPEQMTAAIAGFNAPVVAPVADKAVVEPKASNAWDISKDKAWRTYMVMPLPNSVTALKLQLAVEAGCSHVIVEQTDGTKKFFGALTVAHTRKQFKEVFEPMGCKLHWVTKGSLEERYNWANAYYEKHWTGDAETIGMIERVASATLFKPAYWESFKASHYYDTSDHMVKKGKMTTEAPVASDDVVETTVETEVEVETVVETVVEPVVTGEPVSRASAKGDGYDPFAPKADKPKTVEPAPVDETIFNEETVVETTTQASVKKFVVMYPDAIEGSLLVDVLTIEEIASLSLTDEKEGAFKMLTAVQYRKVSNSGKNLTKFKQRAAKLNARFGFGKA